MVSVEKEAVVVALTTLLKLSARLHIVIGVNKTAE